VRLRTRLVALVVGLAAVALGLAGVAGNVILHRFALQRVDTQLRSFGGRVGAPAGGRFGPATGTPPTGAPPDTATSLNARCDRVPVNLPGTLFELYRSDGTALCAPVSAADPGGGPLVDASVLARQGDGPFTVDGRTGGHEYRVLVRDAPQDTVAVVAIDLSDTTGTWRRQELATGGVGAVLLAMLALGAVLLVRRELRPLEAVTEAADSLAVSDLSRRVAVPASGSEVGRLATAFNTMIDRIERSFTEQRDSEERVRRFAADASHELRTPLASIQGFAELHRSSPTGDEAHDLAWQRVDEEARRLTGLVEDLLALARHDQGAAVRRDAVDLAEVAREAVTDVRAWALDRSIDVDAPDELLVLGDERQLRQVALNLLGNAVAHTPPGTPVAVQLTNGHARPELRVVDHGPGVPPDQRHRVFERFVRLDASRARASGGTGLGLSIVDAIVAGHDGEVWVEDTPGGGATFVVRLPPVAGDDDAADAEPAAG
jgi:two-component system, OmpR family, sensor kinase